ncbi:MAG: hypothetical protein WC678_01870 [Parcubacteria group bacterium]
MVLKKTIKETKKMNTIKRNREINRGTIDQLIKKKHCTLLTIKRFDCAILHGHNLKKGEEKQCHSTEYVNCPAYNHYINHEVIANRRKIGKKSSTEKDEK